MPAWPIVIAPDDSMVHVLAMRQAAVFFAHRSEMSAWPNSRRRTRFVPLRRRRRDRHEFRALRLWAGDEARVDRRRLSASPFPDADLPGVDLVLPDIRFIEAQRANLHGIVITHAHEDHYGALNDLWPKPQVPVWMTPFTAGLLEAKRQYGVRRGRRSRSTSTAPATRSQSGRSRSRPMPVSHSIPEPVSLAITTPLGNVIHTGDWKIDPAPDIGPTDRRGAVPRPRRRGRAGADLRFHQCHARGRIRPPNRRSAASLRERHPEAPGPRGDHHLLLQCRAHPLDRAGGTRLRAARCWCSAARMKRMVDVAGELGYMEGMPPFIAEEDFGYHPAREPRHHLHRQPGRKPGGAGQAGARRDAVRGAVAGRHRGLFLAHHPGQREG